MCNFKIGQKVVCIDASSITDVTKLIEGKIYTVRGFTCKCCTGIYVSEVINSVDLCACFGCRGYWVHEFGYKIERFRPVQYDNISSELVSEFKEIKETSDSPIKELENA